jgi:hypothetical protein
MVIWLLALILCIVSQIIVADEVMVCACTMMFHQILQQWGFLYAKFENSYEFVINCNFK